MLQIWLWNLGFKESYILRQWCSFCLSWTMIFKIDLTRDKTSTFYLHWWYNSVFKLVTFWTKFSYVTLTCKNIAEQIIDAILIIHEHICNELSFLIIPNNPSVPVIPHFTSFIDQNTESPLCGLSVPSQPNQSSPPVMTHIGHLIGYGHKTMCALRGGCVIMLFSSLC